MFFQIRTIGASILLAGLGVAAGLAQLARPDLFSGNFSVALFEDLPVGWQQGWSFEGLTPALTWQRSTLGVSHLPGKISAAGQTMHRSKPFAVRIEGSADLPEGDYEFRLRSRMHARVYLNERLILESEPPKSKQLTAAEIAAKEAEDKKARDEAAAKELENQLREQALRKKLEEAGNDAQAQEFVRAELEKALKGPELSETAPPPQLEEQASQAALRSGTYRFRLEFTGQDLDREVSVIYRRANEPFALLGAGSRIRYTARGWSEWSQGEKQFVEKLVGSIRESRWKGWEQVWEKRHGDLIRKRAVANRKAAAAGVDHYVNAKLSGESVKPAPLTDDYEFVRRIYLEIWGLIPTAEEVREFIKDSRPNKRDLLIDRLLADPKWADPWVGYWEDVLAENPKIYGDVPYATGSFKEWIHRSFVADSGYDRFAVELMLMEGTPKQFGTLGFRESIGNDVPMAEKAMVISQAFMAANMKCARCHDSPLNAYRQRDLFGVAAMLSGEPVPIPASSSVGEVPGRRRPAVPVTNKPGDLISPSFVFDPDRNLDANLTGDRAHRETLAEWLIGHRRFAEVGVNRVWKQLMGTGLVEPVDDWGPGPKISHPELLHYLVDEFIGSGYSIKRVEELIVKSQAYQRRRMEKLAKLTDGQGLPLFAAQGKRRMRAEELVDSLHHTVRREFQTERQSYKGVDYGSPMRTWQVVTLSNEEDHDFRAWPRLQEVITVAGAFGWRDQRPDPVSVRNTDPNPLQTLTLANAALINRLIRLTDASHYTKVSNRDVSLDEFADYLLLNTLSRLPKEEERRWIRRQLEPTWGTRRVPAQQRGQAAKRELKLETFTVENLMSPHLYNTKARDAEPATELLKEDFRKNLEDVLWVIINSPEFVFVP